MAVTSLWRIKGQIGKVVLYATNPDKTVLHEELNIEKNEPENVLNTVIDYTQRNSATENGKLVSTINCSLDNTAEDMMRVKRFFGKIGGTVAYHGYQSFQQDEVTPYLAHSIGVELANKLWGDKYQVVVTTHIDKESHLHNHFVLNTVSFVDGKKYYRSKGDYEKMKEISDELCKEYGLTVIDNPRQSTHKSYTEYTAEQKGAYTKNSMIKKDIDECIIISLNEKQFYREMEKRGYTFDFSNKYPTVSHENFSKPRRLKTLGDEYTPEVIKHRIANSWQMNEVDNTEQENTAVLIFGDNTNVFMNYQTVYRHFVFCIETVRTKGNSYRQLQRLLAEDLIKFDKRVEEQNLLLDNNLYTDVDVINFKVDTQTKLNNCVKNRKNLRNELKCAVRADNVSEQNRIKSEIYATTAEIKKLRRQIAICERIEENEPRIEDEMHNIEKSEIEKQKQEKEKQYLR